MKKLIIFTDSYPAEIGEWPFLAPELDRLKSQFDIYVFCCNADAKINVYVPDFVKIEFINDFSYTKKTKFFILLRSTLNVYFYRELLMLVLNKKFNSILSMLNFWINSVMISRSLKKRTTLLNDCILYTYWNNYATLGAIIYNGKTRIKTSIISRIHRYDLYLNRQNRFYQPFKQIIDRNIAKLFFISQEGKDYYIKHFAKRESNKYVLARLGVRDNGFQECTYQGITKIISCSYVSPVKRINKIIDSLMLIDNKKIEWYHIGDGKLFDEIVEYATIKLGSNSNVSFCFLGKMKNEDIILNYKENYYDIFINTSESEGIPLSMMEAQSFGIPIIGTNVGGVSEIVNDHTGWLLDVNFNEVTIKEIINEYTQLSVDQINEFRHNCRKCYLEKFSSENNYSSFLGHLIGISGAHDEQK